MNLIAKYSAVGLPLKNGFPEFYHVFNHGATTADIGRTGGIDTLGFIDVRKEGDMIFPNRWYSHVLNRNSWHMERPMYGPAVKFVSVAHDGTVFHHAPINGRILPYGVIAAQEDPDFGCSFYHLYLEQDRTLRLILKASPEHFNSLDIVISKYHIANGKYMIRQNQLIDNEYGVEMLAPEQLYDSYLKKEPFRNVHGMLEWKESYFDQKYNALIYSGMRSFEDGGKIPLFMVFGCSEKCSCSETDQSWILRSAWSHESGIAASIAVGEDLDGLLQKVSWSCRKTEERFDELLQETEKNENLSPVISIPAIPEASDFARYVRNAQAALTINDGKYAAILAASGKFGYFIAWDHNYPIRDFITTGDFGTAKRLLRYGIDYPHMKTLAFSVSQLILEISELVAFEGKTDFLKENWIKLQELFDFLKVYVDQKTGMLKTPHCCGVDNPTEIGLSRYFYAACLNAWHYAAARTMANFALLQGDEAKAKQYCTDSEKLKENYPHYFYSAKTGALRVAVNEDYSLPEIEVFHNSSSIGLDYPYGEFLLRKGMLGIARYYKTKLRHPGGYTAITYDSDSPCEMWRSVYMNQHLAHNTRVARLNNDIKEALRVAGHYFQEFNNTGTTIETFNLEGCTGDISQRTKWQAFSATAALHCLHQSIAGIAWSRGGLIYLPCEDDQKIELRNFCFDGKQWQITVEGTGSFVSFMKVNGMFFSGSMQIPADIPLTSENRLEIFRSPRMWTKPVLLYATDLAVVSLEETSSGIVFTAAGDAYTPMKFFAPSKPVIKINGCEIDVEYIPELQTAWVDCRLHTGDKVECLTDNK